LANLSFAARIDDPEFVRMGMNVDETRCEREPVATDALVRFASGEVADRNDSAVRNGDVGGVWRPPAAVEDPGALEDRPEQRLT
jgi:hypothetical protein